MYLASELHKLLSLAEHYLEVIGKRSEENISFIHKVGNKIIK